MTDPKINSVIKLPTQEEVELFANAANIANRISPVQVLTFSENLNVSNLKLMELPQTLVASFELGESIVFRGKPNDSLVMCTKNRCYEIQQADTSNQLLLVPNLITDINEHTELTHEESIHAEVVSSFHETLELKESRPKYERTRVLLNKHPFVGVEHENESATDTTNTFSHLLNETQASEGELKVYLTKIQALEIGGFWRVLGDSFRDSVLIQILSLIEEKDWDWHKFPWQTCLEILSSISPKFILEHVVHIYGKFIDKETVSLDEDLICKFHAECLLKPVRKFSFSEFQEIWQQSVPSGMHTKPEHLLTLSIKDFSSTPPSIWYFPEERLHFQPYERLFQLFSEKDKWTEDEISPFLISLETSKITVSSILDRYTRVSFAGVSKNKFYSLKKTHLL